MEWKKLNNIDKAALIEARLQLHFAAQYCAAFGRYLLPPRKDDSHTSIQWLPDKGVFRTRELSGAERIRIALDPANFALLVEERRGESTQINLAGKTRQEVLDEFHEVLRSKKVNAEQARLDMPYEMPEHVLKNDGRFQLDAATKEAVEVLTACFTNTVQLLQAQFYMEDKASPVRTWPHHFDMATLVKVEGNPDPELAKSIGVGLSTGDETYQEPYFYVTPWPYPDREKPLPELPAGEWHTAGWTGAILHYRDLTSLPAEEQAAIARQFLREAYDLSYGILYNNV